MRSDVRVEEGDSIPVMLDLLRARERFTLIYLDPPFFTGRDHSTTDTGEHAFSDKWGSLEEYVGDLRGRCALARELLESHGSIVVHVDPKISHYVKVALDEVFGRECFASEIVWRYRRWPCRSRNFQRVHDVLLRYVRDARVPPRWNQLYEALSPSTLAVWGGNRKQKAKVEGTRRKRSVLTDEPSLGALMGDVWDLSILAPIAKERTGYPTQKPEKLLERLILALTDEGDSVLDPTCGSGTILAVCSRLGRRSVGIDSSPLAVRISRERLGIGVPSSRRQDPTQ